MYGLVSSFQAVNESVSHDFLFASLGPQYLSFSHLVRYVFFPKYVDHLDIVWIVYNPIYYHTAGTGTQNVNSLSTCTLGNFVM